MGIKHGIPNRNAPFASKEDILKLEDWRRKFQQEPDDVITFGEYFRAESKKKTHFIGQIDQFEAGEENLNLTDNRILIQNVVIMSAQQLKFRIWLYGTSKFYAEDRDEIKAVDFIDFDLTSDGKQYKNAGLWIDIITDLNLLYNDLDQSTKLHIAIENLSAAPKLANSDLIVMVLYESLESKRYEMV